MKRGIKLAIMLSSAFLLTSCMQMSQTKVVTTIAEEVEVVKIESSVSKVYDDVKKGCVGIYAKSTSGASTGSGVIYKFDSENNEYYVVTNAHVVEKYTTYFIYFDNNIYVSADLIGYDSKNDVAVLKFNLDLVSGITKDDIKVIDFFNYDPEDIVTVGQTVLAIGCPNGLENFNYLTTGIVSKTTYSEVSIDAAINPGNSGGGLFNLNGHLIGINYEKTVWTTSSGEKIPLESFGRAISIDVVKTCINDIMSMYSNVVRPLIGITITMTNSVVENTSFTQYKDYLPDTNKVSYMIVISFNETDEKPSNGKTSGLELYDVILEADGKEINTNTDLSDILNYKKVGESIELKVYRSSDASVHTINVILN